MAVDPSTQAPCPPEPSGASRARRLKDACFGHRHDITLGGVAATAREALATGFETLDRYLPGGGWPLGALVEILVERDEPGCLWLILPALAELSRRQQWVALIAPPLVPYAPALAGRGVDIGKILLVHPRRRTDGLWAVEEALASPTCSSVVFWLAGPDDKAARRLQLAAERGGTLGFCFRPVHHADRRSTAAVRIRAVPADDGASLDILKVRGGRAHRGIRVRRPDLAQ